MDATNLFAQRSGADYRKQETSHLSKFREVRDNKNRVTARTGKNEQALTTVQ